MVGNNSIHYHRRADIDLAFFSGGQQLFNGDFTLELEKMLVNAGSESSPLEFTTIDSTVSFNRMLYSHPMTIPANADYIDFLITLHVRDFVHPAAYSSEWDTPLLTLNLVNASNDAVLASFRALTFKNLVNCQNTDIDTSLIIRMNVHSYRGGQIYSKVDLMTMKQPFITEVYNFDTNMALMKNRGMIVYEETSENYIIPEEYSLFQNYPNPFNAQTTINTT